MLLMQNHFVYKLLGSILLSLYFQRKN